jgi:CheY-like chemotaxis protein/HPt (histidine-containing phosphotransfer) domain-containing protein
VIDDVLDFSKIEAGKLDIVCEEFDVSSVVDGVVETVSYRDPEKKLALSGIIDRNVPLKLQGDPMRLRQILLNLAGNAVKFTAKGEVVVRVWLVKISGDSMRLRFEVTDSGVGLTQEQVGKLFQPFVQADSSTARRYGGTGLGLAISHKLVGLMGGEIGAKSALNLGSTFWFELPLGVPAQPSLPISHPGLVLAHAIVGSGQPLIRESLQEQFSRWGVPCDVAGTADDFSRMLSEMAGEGHAVFALCDEELLVQGGANLRQQLRHLRDKAWCVLLASPATVVSEDKADSGLFKAILVKPVRKSLLFDSLVAAVEDGSPASSGKKASNIVSSLGSGQFSALRILVAEDHKINLKLSLAMLKSLGASADVATNGTEALVAVRRKVYDLILMDCHMPEMDGYQATAAIRQWEDSHPNNQRHRARIVALTANALREERERCLDVGMDDYMSKPFTSTQLRQVLSMATQACTAQGEVSHVDDEFLNATRLNELCADLGAEGIKEIIGAFMRDLPESLTELKRFAQSRNWIEAVRTANSLKGVCASFGLVMLTGQLNAMEQAAADNDAETSQRLQDELEPLAKLSADAFQQWLQTARSNS